MSRSKSGQAEHDREVKKVANEYLRKGYKVLADLPNQERPDTVKGVRPDLSVKKKGHKTLIEVETPESVGSKRDEKHHGIFKPKESSPRNKRPHKIDWAYISHLNYLKATGQAPVLRFTVTVELHNRDY